MAVVLSVVGNVDLKQLQAAETALGKLVTSAERHANGTWAKAFDTMGNKAIALGKKMESTGRSLTMGVTLPLVGLGAFAFKSAADFETAMNQVQAATDAPADKMAELTALAKKMGADTIFSAGEAADAMLELAKAGMDPAAISAGGLDAALKLAAAGNVSLESAATTAANALNTFGLGADKANDVANALAGGANASSASVDSLQQALAQVGPGAKNAGLDLQRTVAVLAAFADKGIQGSDAGTSLKTMLSRLVPQTDEAADAMERYGLSFVDGAGNIDDITVVASKLQQRLGGLSEAQRMQALQTIFGSDATRAATVLMQEGATGIEKYIAATNDQNAAQAMADARMKGWAGSMEQMRGSAETASIALGEALAPAVTEVAGGIKELADRFAQLDPEQQEAIAKALVFAAAIGPVLIGVGKLSQGLGAVFKVASTATTGIKHFTDGLRGAETASKTLSGKAGTLAGSLKGLDGASFGATLGLAGLSFGVGMVAGEFISSLPAVEKWRDTMVSAVADAEDAGKNVDVNGWLNPISWAYSKVAEGAYKAAGAGKANAEVTAESAAMYKELGIELDKNGAVTERGIQQLKEHNASLGADTASAQGLAFATRDLALAQQVAQGATMASNSAELTMLQTKQAVKAATENLTSAIKLHGKGSDEARIAQLQLTQAQENATTAAADYKVKVDAAKKAEAELARQKDLDDKLKKIEAEWRKAGEAADVYRSKAQRALAIDVQDSGHSTSGPQEKARGGFNPGVAERIIWGEDGPEVIIPLSAKYRAEALQLMPRVFASLGLNNRSAAQNFAATAPASASIAPAHGGGASSGGGITISAGAFQVQIVLGDGSGDARTQAYDGVHAAWREIKQELEAL